KELN
ncbi:MV membrane EFC component, partial [Monkeypox virus]